MPHAPEAWAGILEAGGPVFSTDGRRLFHLRGAGGLMAAWVMDADGGNASQLSHHAEKVGPLRRAPKDDRLIWSTDTGGDENHALWLLPPGEATAHPLTHAPAAMHIFGGWSPDGTRIAYAANDRDPKVFDAVVMNLETRAVSRLYQGPCQITVAGWSPDGATIIVIEDHGSSDQRLVLVDVATGRAHAVPRPRDTRYQAVRFTADGTLMAITDAPDSDMLRLSRLDPATGAATPVFAPLFRDVDAWALSPNGEHLATLENDGGLSTLRLGAPGTHRPAIPVQPGSVLTDLAWAPDSASLILTAQSPTTPPALFRVQNGEARPLPLPDPFAGTTLRSTDLIAPTATHWTSFDGTRIPTWLYLPHGPRPATGWPSLMWIHGGPAWQQRADWRPEMQMLLDQGYALLVPNMRGSTGYGRAYMEADEVELRFDYLQDMATGHAFMAAHPALDPARIGIIGESYGGWATLAGISMQPDLWKAAVDYFGLSDMIGFYHTTSPYRRDHRAREYGFPSTDEAVLRELSPIQHVGKIKAPLLVLHADRDPRVPMGQSDLIVAAMQERQMKVTYEKYEHGGHGFVFPEHRRRAFTAIADHLQQHLSGDV
jgi:dipeptidyl aminopeptidase/acylaminoacyl peptidase